MKNETKFTPGPILFNGEEDTNGYFMCTGIEGEGGRVQIAMPRDPNSEIVFMNPSDVSLFAEAPNMYEALSEFVEMFKGGKRTRNAPELFDFAESTLSRVRRENKC